MFFPHSTQSGRYILQVVSRATAHRSLCYPVFAELFENFAFGMARLVTDETSLPVFCLGEVPPPAAPERGYAIRVTESGAAVAAKNEKDLLHGVFTLFDLIAIDENGTAYLPQGAWKEMPQIPLRMVHFCVFPETELWELRRLLRLAAVLKYTHAVIEFWGTYRFSCLPELGWKNAFTQGDLAPVIEEAHLLGLELIPMFNHWGHAGGSRVAHGKHVVLDQNPAMQNLFDDTGWCWNFRSERVRRLLRAVRGELSSLCGKGEYFHIGCDEAYGFSTKDAGDICRFINETGAELRTAGRKTILWGDMLLSPDDAGKDCFASAPGSTVAGNMRAALSKDLLIADWQYDAKTAPVATSRILKKAGFAVLLSSWDRSIDNADAVLRTVREEELAGVLHTTWHTLSTGLPFVGRIAAGCWANIGVRGKNDDRIRLSALLRRVSPACGEYERAGFCRKDTSV